MASATLTPFGTETYYIQVFDQFGCVAFDSVTIQGDGVNIELADIELLCQGDTLELSVTNLDSDDILTYSWSPTAEILEGENTANPIVFPQNSNLIYGQCRQPKWLRNIRNCGHYFE